MGGKGDELVGRLIGEMRHHNHHKKKTSSHMDSLYSKYAIDHSTNVSTLISEWMFFLIKYIATYEEASNTDTSPLAIMDVGK